MRTMVLAGGEGVGTGDNCIPSKYVQKALRS